MRGDSAKLKVLHVLGALNLGGIETWLMHVLRHIDREAFQLDFCCLSGEEGTYASEAKSLGSRVFPIKLTKNLPTFNKQFSRLLEEQQYDVVHSHVHQFSGYILRQAAKNGVQGRITHSFTAPKQSGSLIRLSYLKLMSKWLAQYATLGLGNSTESMCSLYEPDWQSNPQRRLLYCGIDLTPFELGAPTYMRKEWGIPETAPVIGHVGRLTEAKNHRFALDIATAMMEIAPEVWFLFVGDGPLRTELKTFARQKGLRQVVFTGPVDDVIPLLKSMDMFLFPSLWEGLPQSIIEAQAVGLRCLCSDVVTREVVVVPEAVQFLSLDAPAADWAQKSKSMLAVPKIDGHEAWKMVAASHFAIETGVRELMCIYQESVQG